MVLNTDSQPLLKFSISIIQNTLKDSAEIIKWKERNSECFSLKFNYLFIQTDF